MTQLIVALDGPDPLSMMKTLRYIDASDGTHQEWFKVGPQTFLRTLHDAAGILDRARHVGIKIFLDLKWADTTEIVAEAFRLAHGHGVAAVSTFTTEATLACQNTGIRGVAVWQVHALTDRAHLELAPMIGAPGVICPGSLVKEYTGGWWVPKEIIVPGVRLPGDGYAHKNGCTTDLIRGIADYAVVGRPIYLAADSVEAAAAYRRALA